MEADDENYDDTVTVKPSDVDIDMDLDVDNEITEV